MKGYPVMLDLANKHAVVIGGGTVATRKVLTLLTSSEANITVISPEISDTLKHLAQTEQIIWRKKQYECVDIEKAFLVIVATNDKELNRSIAKQCKPHQLVNVASEAKYGNFIVPASLRRGNITISVSTDGLNPRMAKKVCNEIALIFDETYETYLETERKSNSKICH